MKYLSLSLLIFSILTTHAQVADSTKALNQSIDSLIIQEVEGKHGSNKVLHAEPLYIDLIRDLGARKGEKEWNVGVGLTDNRKYDEYIALVEYEWAPIDRLGFEVEVPLLIYQPHATVTERVGLPKSKINSLKLATQYSFFVSEKLKTSMAIGYIHEFEMTDFRSYGKSALVVGNVYNPFFVAAKRWGQNFHTLIYTGPQVFHHFSDDSFHTLYQINANFHYMIDGTRNFVGIEFNKEISEGDFEMTVRPQMRVGIADNLLIGIVTGIPINREIQSFSSFLRLIYEPGHKHHVVLK